VTRIKGTYGIDAPYVPIAFGVLALVAFVLAALTTANGGWFGWFVVGLFFLVQGVIYVHTTFRGKFVIWSRLLDRLDPDGGATTLDVGCGRGMVLITTALRLTDGRATGIDLWRSRDQSGNGPARTQANADENGVGDRIGIETADMTALPMADATFDLVTANVALQNLKNRELRRTAIGEMFRVAKPGAPIVIVDIQYTQEYRDDLVELGAQSVAIRNLGLDGWYGNPFFASKLVSARKP
jgi:SAM-dependent methyltransferase